MRRLICLGTIACLAWSSTAAASASTSKGAGPSSKTKPSLCKKASYTADGGYESAGHFYWEPGDDVTLITNWCYSRGVITSHSVSYTTTIPESLSPQIRTNESLIKGRGGPRRTALYGLQQQRGQQLRLCHDCWPRDRTRTPPLRQQLRRRWLTRLSASDVLVIIVPVSSVTRRDRSGPRRCLDRVRQARPVNLPF